MLECIREGALHSKTNKKVRGLQFQETFAKRTKLHICNKYSVVSMTSLLTHNVAHSTTLPFKPKTNNQPIKKCLKVLWSVE